jgi:5-methylcytosine-specific restriction protein B
MLDRNEEDIFAYGAQLWEKGNDLTAKQLKLEEALEFLKSRFNLYKESVKDMAGFDTEAGRQLGLALRGGAVNLFVEPGDWESLVPGVMLKKSYAKNEPRTSSLQANAPKLWVGFPTQKISIPSMVVLSSFCDVYDGEPSNAEVPAEHTMSEPNVADDNSYPGLNRILYGPPGTGKTYSTAKLAVEICDGDADMSREDLMDRYEELRRDNRICFVTFHQSYGYEDFVEGLRPELKDGQVSYRVRPGVFREICDAARLNTLVKPGLSGKPLKERTIYKMSLGVAGTTEGQTVLQECIEKGYVLLGWGENVDFSECDSEEAISQKIAEDRPEIDRPDSQARYAGVFKNELQVGDIIVVSQGNRSFRAVGEVTGEYEFLEAPTAGAYHQMRPVRWLAVLDANRSVDDIYDRNFVQSALYRLDHNGLKLDVLEGLLKGQQGGSSQPYVLIIDEINRANLSKVFGELITLLEPDKREGAANSLTVKLPYSGDDFSVPANLFIVGTMNTADRSIALLDTALRRRFDFEELQPDYETLPPEPVAGVDLRTLLRAMNDRIEYLYDRDHTIGHAYFVAVKNRTDLDRLFRRKIIPLLQEYFYEDWSKVCLVLNDTTGGFIEPSSAIPKGLHGATDGYDVKPRYRVKEAFALDAYLKIYE